MKLVFYAQVDIDGAHKDHLKIIRTTKQRPTGPDGQVIKFDIDIPESVLYPEVKASLVGLQTVAKQALASLQESAKSLKT